MLAASLKDKIRATAAEHARRQHDLIQTELALQRNPTYPQRVAVVSYAAMFALRARTDFYDAVRELIDTCAIGARRR